MSESKKPRYKKQKRSFPKAAQFFFEFMSHDECESRSGDFEEQFLENCKERGVFSAHIYAWIDIFSSIPRFLHLAIYWRTLMIKSYIKAAFRNISRNKIYSLINISGLAAGLACFILITLFIRDELSFDQFHENSDRIYRVVDSFDRASGLWVSSYSSAPFAPTLKAEFPEVEDAVRIMSSRRLVKQTETIDYEDYVLYADESFFSIFSFSLAEGNPATVLDEPLTVVIDKAIAAKYFRNEDPIDKMLTVSGVEFRVTGIMEKFPDNSHFQAGIIMSMKTLEQQERYKEQYFTKWSRHEFHTYILLQENYNYNDLESKLPALIEKHAAEQIQNLLGSKLITELQPLTSIHLYSNRLGELMPNGDINQIYIFAIAALLVLILACINFTNLSIALSTLRVREIGMRRVVGADRQQLINQFIGETEIYTFFSLLISLFIIWGTIPFFNNLTGKNIAISALANPFMLILILSVTVAVGFISGSYPALLASKANPSGIFRSEKGNSPTIRRTLVIFQFAITIILVICSVTILEQVDFMQNKKLGFSKDNVVTVPVTHNSMRNSYETLKEELKAHPAILNASISIGVPSGIVAGDAIDFVTPEGPKKHTVRMFYTDHDFIKTLGMEIVEGRDFSKEITTDATDAIIINEAAAKIFGSQNPLELEYIYDEKRGNVIGVVKDFQFASLKDEISPLVIQIQPMWTRLFAIKLRAGQEKEALEFIEQKWNSINSETPFEYTFLDEKFDKLYQTEQKMSSILQYFSFIAYFIATLGLFGMATFIITRRTKEIGIRKVMGASETGIILLISKEFVLWVVIANVIAWPIAYFAMGKWLNRFAYGIDQSYLVYITSGAVAVLIAIITIFVQTIKAARANPVNALKHE